MKLRSVAIHPGEIEVPASMASALVGDLTRHGLSEAGHLTGMHLGLMAVAGDAGWIPGPKGYRSSRDIGPIERGLADLETLGIIEPIGAAPHLVHLRSEYEDALRSAADRWFEARTVALLSELHTKTEDTPCPSSSLAQTWLRFLLVLIAYHGLRITASGELHHGDLRALTGAVELPTRKFLALCLELGTSLGVLLPLGERLLIGEGLDRLDLSRVDFAREAHGAWLDGSLPTHMPLVSAMAGLFEGWAAGLGQAASRSRQGTPYPADALIGTPPGEPVSNFLDDSGLDFDAMLREIGGGHRALRAGILGLLSALPAGTHALTTVAELVHCRIALHLLRRPLRLVDGRTAVASLTHLLPFAPTRVYEHLPGLLEVIGDPLGVSITDRELGRITIRAAASWADVHDDALPRDGTFELPVVHARTPGPPSGKRVDGRPAAIVQPSGEVMIPAESSIHGLLHVAHGADLRRLDQMMVFEISGRSLLRVADAGMDLSTWESGLADLTAVPIPSTVTEMIASCAAREGEFELAPAGAVIVARDSVRLDEALSHRALRHLLLVRASDTVAVLKHGAALEETLELLADRGFSVRVVDQPSRLAEP